MGNIAVLFDEEITWDGSQPFVKESINGSYAYFSGLVEREGGKFFFGKFRWYEDGKLTKAFVFEDGEWRKVEDVPVDAVFDKYMCNEESMPTKKEIAERHPVLNDIQIDRICSDKSLTYEKFPEYHPETQEATEENVREFIEEDGKAVLKKPKDHGGEGIEVIESIEEFEPEEGLLVQRFVDSTQGIEELGIDGVHDLRVVVVNGDPKISYVREPESGFISNVAQGGSITFVDLEDIPQKAMEIVETVSEEFEKFENHVFGVDMIFDEEQEPWILELNSKPGMVFYGDEEVKEKKRPYYEAVIDILAEMSNS